MPLQSRFLDFFLPSYWQSRRVSIYLQQECNSEAKPQNMPSLRRILRFYLLPSGKASKSLCTYFGSYDFPVHALIMPLQSRFRDFFPPSYWQSRRVSIYLQQECNSEAKPQNMPSLRRILRFYLLTSGKASKSLCTYFGSYNFPAHALIMPLQSRFLDFFPPSYWQSQRVSIYL